MKHNTSCILLLMNFQIACQFQSEFKNQMTNVSNEKLKQAMAAIEASA